MSWPDKVNDDGLGPIARRMPKLESKPIKFQPRVYMVADSPVDRVELWAFYEGGPVKGELCMMQIHHRVRYEHQWAAAIAFVVSCIEQEYTWQGFDRATVETPEFYDERGFMKERAGTRPGAS